MRVLHVVPSYFPADAYGGPVESVHQLCQGLAQRGCTVRVLTTNANGRDRVLAVDTRRPLDVGDGVRVRYCRRIGRHAASPDLLRVLGETCRWADVVHLTGVYSFPTIPTLLACRLLDRPVVWSPRGSLQRWTGSTRVRLKRIWEQICLAVAPRRLVLHTTSAAEAEATATRVPTSRVVVIANGIELSPPAVRVEQPGMLRLLYLGRLHPIKAIDRLLAALQLFQARSDKPMDSWSLTIAGAGDAAYVAGLHQQVRALGLGAHVTFTGHVDASARTALFAASDILVLPSHSENFGMVVVEALAAGVPVVASRGTPWQALDIRGCGRWVDNDPASLADAIVDLAGRPRAQLGERGRRWMETEFTWPSIAERMVAVYESIRN